MNKLIKTTIFLMMLNFTVSASEFSKEFESLKQWTQTEDIKNIKDIKNTDIANLNKNQEQQDQAFLDSMGPEDLKPPFSDSISLKNAAVTRAPAPTQVPIQVKENHGKRRIRSREK